MLKVGPLWAIYTASYFIDYVLILGILVWKKLTDIAVKFPKNMVALDWIIWIVLLTLIIFSVLIMKGIKRIQMTSRIKFDPKDDSVWEVYAGFLAPAIALVSTLVDEYGVLLSFVLFVVTGIAFVKSKQVHLASVFIFPMRYKIYKGDGGIIISRDTRDGLRLKMLTDGVQAKELERGIYLVQ